MSSLLEKSLKNCQCYLIKVIMTSPLAFGRCKSHDNSKNAYISHVFLMTTCMQLFVQIWSNNISQFFHPNQRARLVVINEMACM